MINSSPQHTLTFESMTSDTSLNIITYNVKGIHSSKIRLKLAEYYKSKTGYLGVIFFQKTHSSVLAEKNWTRKFSSPTYFHMLKQTLAMSGFFLE